MKYKIGMGTAKTYFTLEVEAKDIEEAKHKAALVSGGVKIIKVEEVKC